MPDFFNEALLLLTKLLELSGKFSKMITKVLVLLLEVCVFLEFRWQ